MLRVIWTAWYPEWRTDLLPVLHQWYKLPSYQGHRVNLNRTKERAFRFVWLHLQWLMDRDRSMHRSLDPWQGVARVQVRCEFNFSHSICLKCSFHSTNDLWYGDDRLEPFSRKSGFVKEETDSIVAVINFVTISSINAVNHNQKEKFWHPWGRAVHRDI